MGSNSKQERATSKICGAEDGVAGGGGGGGGGKANIIRVRVTKTRLQCSTERLVSSVLWKTSHKAYKQMIQKYYWTEG